MVFKEALPLIQNLAYYHNFSGAHGKQPLKPIWKFCDEVLPADFSDSHSDTNEELSYQSFSVQETERMSGHHTCPRMATGHTSVMHVPTICSCFWNRSVISNCSGSWIFSSATAKKSTSGTDLKFLYAVKICILSSSMDFREIQVTEWITVLHNLQHGGSSSVLFILLRVYIFLQSINS